MTPTYLSLGATLYVPATRGDLVAIANGYKYPQLRSVIFCTEDAVAEADVPRSLDNLRAMLSQLAPANLQRFIRVRHPGVLAQLLDCEHISRINGFVIPKATCASLPYYLEQLSPDQPFHLMPTLETVEVFDTAAMHAFRAFLEDSPFASRILAIRVGGNDLLHLLGLRRRSQRTLYETPLGALIGSLVTMFHPAGFPLTAPVFEGMSSPKTLRREVERDLDHGLCSKTAIHPAQIRWIESRYAVSDRDFEAAQSILCETTPVVFRLHNAMCEKATHVNWAKWILERHRLFGLRRQPRPAAQLGDRSA